MWLGEKLQSIKDKVRLDVKSREQTRNVLLAHVEKNPLRVGNVDRHSIQSNPIISPVVWFQKHMYTFAKVALVILFGGAATSFAAERSLPGDFLYPVKTSFNEKAVAAASFGAKAKADWQTQLVERRLEEANALAAQGKLSDELQDEVEAGIKNQTESAEENIAELRSSGDVNVAADIASELESSMRAHQKILAEIEAKENKNGETSLHIKINPILGDVIKIRGEAESEIEKDGDSPSSKTAAEGKINATANAISSVRAYIESNKAKLGTEATAKARARLDQAEKLNTDAQAKLNAGAYAEAFAKASEAMRIAKEARVLVETNINLDLNLKLNIESSDDVEGNDEHATSSIENEDKSENELKLDDHDKVEFEHSSGVKIGL